jgi:hypothetical protein
MVDFAGISVLRGCECGIRQDETGMEDGWRLYFTLFIRRPLGPDSWNRHIG